MKNNGKHTSKHSAKRNNSKSNLKNVIMAVVLIAFAAVLIGVFYLPQKMEEYQANKFAEPLYDHLLPENSYTVQVSSSQNEAGETMAVAIIGTHLSEDELYAFYADTEYKPAREGDEVDLTVKPLDEASIEVLKQAGKYREEDKYYFVYIYSSKAE